MDPNLIAAVTGANNIQAPAPVFQSSLGPEISALNAAGFKLPQSEGATNALGNQSQDIVSEQKRAAAAAKAAAKYQKIAKKDGGFGFVDPDGNEITAEEYAKATGKSISEVLKDSDNPIDKAFLNDHKQLDQYIKDKQAAKTDKAARGRAQAVETQVRKLYGIKMHQQDPREIVNAFRAAYPTVFGGTAPGKQGTSTLLPTAESLKKKGSSNTGASGF